ncbi:MAG: aminotransferase class V-fold PLP-dependent enzyme [Candidatus Roizmanbacteria bacterium]
MDFRHFFPIFKNNPNLVYLDSAATALKPQSVISAEVEYYTQYSANVHRGLYDIAAQATEKYEGARKICAEFFGADTVIFAKSATEALNLLAYCLVPKQKGTIVITNQEHHSNYLPWVELAKKYNKKIEIIDTLKKGFVWAKLAEYLPEDTSLVSFVHISNVLGDVLDVPSIVKSIRKKCDAIICIDGAQSASHSEINYLKNEGGADFVVASGHKMFGPTGIGVVGCTKISANYLSPFMYGGEMVLSIQKEKITYQDQPLQMEAGTQPIAQAIGIGAAISFIQEIGLETIEKQVKDVTEYTAGLLNEELRESIQWVSGEDFRSGILTYTIKGVHPHDVAEILNSENICVRAGHHCAMPLHEKLGIPASVRASFHVYNTREDGEKLVEGMRKVRKIFNI